MAKTLFIHKLNFSYDGKTNVVQDLNMSIRHDPQFISIMGASGCGKSTLLRLVAGLEIPDSGTISFDSGKTKPQIGFIFQKYSSFPNMTVLDNVAFGLKLKGMDKAERHAIATDYLKKVDLADQAYKYPKQLSGGQQQRVAIARSLAVGSDILCMDEPFGNLDYVTTEAIQAMLCELWENEKPMALNVTHNVESAVFLSDLIFIMSPKTKNIIHKVTIDLPFHRTDDVRNSTKYFDYVKYIRSLRFE